MVQRIKILLVVIICIIPFHFAKAQTADSFNCDKFYEWLDAGINIDLSIIYWSRPPLPQPTETNRTIFCELCDMIVNDSVKNSVVALLLNENGNPVCDRIYSENIPDSLRNEIRKMLYKLEFNPAIGTSPVMSHYSIIFNSQHCNFYKDSNAFKKTFTITPSRNEIRRNRRRQ